jgi:hypothetical protein
VIPEIGLTTLQVVPLFDEVTNPIRSPVAFDQSGGNSGWLPPKREVLTVLLERTNAPYTFPPAPVANVGSDDDGHWHVDPPITVAGPHVEPLVVELAQATLEAVQDLKTVPLVALQSGPNVV